MTVLAPSCRPIDLQGLHGHALPFVFVARPPPYTQTFESVHPEHTQIDDEARRPIAGISTEGIHRLISICHCDGGPAAARRHEVQLIPAGDGVARDQFFYADNWVGHLGLLDRDLLAELLWNYEPFGRKDAVRDACRRELRTCGGETCSPSVLPQASSARRALAPEAVDQKVPPRWMVNAEQRRRVRRLPRSGPVD
jgi:hypothetical protein